MSLQRLWIFGMRGQGKAMTNKQRRQIIDGYIPPFKAREGEREMKADKYSVVNDNGKIAEHMTLMNQEWA